MIFYIYILYMSNINVKTPYNISDTLLVTLNNNRNSKNCIKEQVNKLNDELKVLKDKEFPNGKKFSRKGKKYNLFKTSKKNIKNILKKCNVSVDQNKLNCLDINYKNKTINGLSDLDLCFDDSTLIGIKSPKNRKNDELNMKNCTLEQCDDETHPCSQLLNAKDTCDRLRGNNDPDFLSNLNQFPNFNNNRNNNNKSKNRNNNSPNFLSNLNQFPNFNVNNNVNNNNNKNRNNPDFISNLNQFPNYSNNKFTNNTTTYNNLAKKLTDAILKGKQEKIKKVTQECEDRGEIFSCNTGPDVVIGQINSDTCCKPSNSNNGYLTNNFSNNEFNNNEFNNNEFNNNNLNQQQVEINSNQQSDNNLNKQEPKSSSSNNESVLTDVTNNSTLGNNVNINNITGVFVSKKSNGRPKIPFLSNNLKSQKNKLKKAKTKKSKKKTNMQIMLNNRRKKMHINNNNGNNSNSNSNWNNSDEEVNETQINNINRYYNNSNLSKKIMNKMKKKSKKAT